jgi:GNAT superfamily N-acetyltransferase
MNIITDIENKKIILGDIVCKRENKGYGSMAMNILIDYAEKNGNINGIEGFLSYNDERYFDKLVYFYRKFGFSIIKNKNQTNILKVIN